MGPKYTLTPQQRRALVLSCSTETLEAILDSDSDSINGHFGKCEPRPCDVHMIVREIHRRQRIHDRNG